MKCECGSDRCDWDKSLRTTICAACGGRNTAVFEADEDGTALGEVHVTWEPGGCRLDFVVPGMESGCVHLNPSEIKAYCDFVNRKLPGHTKP